VDGDSVLSSLLLGYESRSDSVVAVGDAQRKCDILGELIGGRESERRFAQVDDGLRGGGSDIVVFH